MYLLAPSVMQLAPAEMAARVRARFGDGLRRVGTFAQLCLLGAQACLDAARVSAPLALLCASERGALRETRAALNDDLANGEPSMPFAFIGTQPHLAGALLAQRATAVTRATHVHLAPGDWPWLLRIAGHWLSEDAFVLTGWTEESLDDGLPHRTGWCLLARAPAAGAVRCETSAATAAALEASAEGWLARVAAWRDATPAPREPLTLRGAGQAWRFVPAA